MKHILLPFILAFSTVVVVAQTKSSTLVLWHSDGTQTRIELYTRPQVIFTADGLTITSPVATMYYKSTDVLRFTYENVKTGIPPVTMSTTYKQNGQNIYFSGITATDKVSLYTIDGKRISVSMQFTDRGLCLPLSSVPAGIYLLTVNGRTAKFVKK